jgi:hypothetical protein
MSLSHDEPSLPELTSLRDEPSSLPELTSLRPESPLNLPSCHESDCDVLDISLSNANSSALSSVQIDNFVVPEHRDGNSQFVEFSPAFSDPDASVIAAAVLDAGTEPDDCSSVEHAPPLASASSCLQNTEFEEQRLQLLREFRDRATAVEQVLEEERNRQHSIMLLALERRKSSESDAFVTPNDADKEDAAGEDTANAAALPARADTANDVASPAHSSRVSEEHVADCDGPEDHSRCSESAESDTANDEASPAHSSRVSEEHVADCDGPEDHSRCSEYDESDTANGVASPAHSSRVSEEHVADCDGPEDHSRCSESAEFDSVSEVDAPSEYEERGRRSASAALCSETEETGNSLRRSRSSSPRPAGKQRPRRDIRVEIPSPHSERACEAERSQSQGLSGHSQGLSGRWLLRQQNVDSVIHAQLTEMGFDSRIAIVALEQTGSASLQDAIDFCLDHGNEDYSGAFRTDIGDSDSSSTADISVSAAFVC